MRFLPIIIPFLAVNFAVAQGIKIPSNISEGHPRLITKASSGKNELKKRLDKELWAKETYLRAKKAIDVYVDRHQSDPTWIVSRLQMYWKTKSTDVFVKGPVYSHATGEAPVPTVRYTGARDAVSSYAAPKLEDILPYMDDPRGLLLVNTSVPGRPLEWVEPSKAGRVVESINRNIVGMARTAAFFYWFTGEEKYARFASDIFDTYMQGMYYRKEPVDLNHSHIQTLVGLTSFEVIHEDILDDLTLCYDFLYTYLARKSGNHLPIYSDTFKKWADLIIKNGVPFNNWNLIEAKFVSQIALVLENNNQYKDGKGAQFYLNRILNESELRQWSLPRLIKYGFDENTGIWNESPGYSSGVVKDFISLATLYDDVLNFDLLDQLPVLKKAVLALPEYLYPTGYTVAFGDSYYYRLSLEPAFMMVANSQKHKKKEQEELFTRYIKTIRKISGENEETKQERKPSDNILQLFSSASVKLRDDIKAGEPQEFMSAGFSAPNSSYYVQRNGFSASSGMMISQAGSKGNHAHANGIAMELIGKGIVMAPEAGIGTSYFQQDYKEYYSQFPAHNTVVVNGISSYPEMRSNHGFEVRNAYPASGVKDKYFDKITYSDVYFLEPETNSDQRRLMSIVRIDSVSGYYVDIFRSRKKQGGDKYQDYFYHNLGQELIIDDSKGSPLKLNPTDKLAFADGDLFAYDYIWDKRSATFAGDFTAKFKLNYPGLGNYQMNVWMKGFDGREVFSVKTPVAKATTRGLLSDTIAHLPVPALVVRQSGAAWNKPFAAVLEPTKEENRAVKSISSFAVATADTAFTGLKVELVNNCTDLIFSSVSAAEACYEENKAKAQYAVIRKRGQSPVFLFLGGGTHLSTQSWSIDSELPANASLEIKADRISYSSNQAIKISFSFNSEKDAANIMLEAENGVKLRANRIAKGVYSVQLGPSEVTELLLKL